MREEDAFRQTRRAGCVKDRCAGVLIEVRKFVSRISRRQHRLVVSVPGEVLGLSRLVGDADEFLRRRQPVPEGLEQRQELSVAENDLAFGVVECVKNLLRGQADVHRVQDRSEHRHGKVCLEIAVAVPVHDGDSVAGPDA
jgi:hypothetical protein